MRIIYAIHFTFLNLNIFRKLQGGFYKFETFLKIFIFAEFFSKI